MPQPHLVKRGSTFYFRIAVPSALVDLLGRREFKTSLRTSDAISAKMRARALSSRLELIFRDIRMATAHAASNAIATAAQDYFRAQLSKSLEIVSFAADPSAMDRHAEIAGTKQ